MAIRLLLLVLFLPALALGQEKGTMSRARAEYTSGDYPATIRTLRNSKRLTRNDPEARLLLAVSLFHTNDLPAAKAELDELVSNRGDAFPVARFYLGRVYHAQNLFPEAAEAYKEYARTLDQEGEAWLAVTALLRNVANGIRMASGGESVLVDNLGPKVNTPNDEFGAIPSQSGSGRVYFTALQPGIRGTAGHTDILVTEAFGTAWAPREAFNPLLNTLSNETVVDISPSGNRIYYFRGASEREGEYLVDTFRADAPTELITIAPEVNLSIRTLDVTPFYAADDAVYFASDRPDGYGGLDLYRKARLPEGGYGPAENLGPTVNSPYDEISPFVANDGRTIYFSTNDPDFSIGGFDIVRTFRVKGAEGQYTLPVNVGLPINSAGDDTHFRLAPDSFTAFLTSNRKDGYGKRDLYVAYYPTARLEMQ
ncbi:tetratricopeptide repeat protein [Lewinella sp. 4G2]|uniref:tetratricopeptide repeat protein n=1 Tax=Lewinella sp. 4G2 TaxID=1803372 RepID=UPI0007B4F14B|nr:tetratricopeptide repeat protein [Lewinella sp. 4G2]OAV43065.1 hypothetical protein A3850_000475 [Lewinella sp. 4G2]